MQTSVISQFFVPHTLTPFNFPASPQAKIFQNSWTISTTVLGEEGRMRLNTVLISICVPTTIHAYNSLHLLLTAHPEDLQEVAVMN